MVGFRRRRPNEGGKLWKVVCEDTGKIKAQSDSKEAAGIYCAIYNSRERKRLHPETRHG